MPLVTGIKGFGGYPVIEEKPIRKLGDSIPWEGVAAGVTIEYDDNEECYILYDKFDSIIYQWPDNYTPTEQEVKEQVYAYLKSIGRNVF